MIRLNDILDEVKKHEPNANLDIIRKAYVYSAKAHSGQIRQSREPYIMHPLEVAFILAKMRMDELTVATGLLHDTVEDNPASSLDQIRELFGEEILGLVDGVTKISKMKYVSREMQQAESFKKILIATSKDLRVILVKLADRLHNMRTLEHMPPPKRLLISQETIDIYAPLANRLGIQWVKNELEDLSFRYLNPRAYYDIILRLSKWRRERDKFIHEIIKFIQEIMDGHGIESDVKGREKNVHSIFKKMKDQGLEFDQVYDLIAFRIILGSVAECYEALGYIHSTWKPVPGRFKDYIALPKANMYQSLHTTVIGPYGQRMEIQIRTLEMNRIAEEGVAAHWRYKEGGAKSGQSDDKKFHWLRKLVEMTQEENPREYLKMVKTDLFPDDVYVFTPKGDVISFPRGATPIDFAYRIHTEVGHQCVGAKANGQIVPLTYQMVSGDRMEVLTRKDHTPSRDWLKIVKTNTARSKIREFLRRLEQERSVEAGRLLAEKELRKHKISMTRLEKSGKLAEVANALGFHEVETLLSNLGVGKLSMAQFLHHFLANEEEVSHLREDTLDRILRPFQKQRGTGGIKIQGIDDVVFSLAKCCNPLPGEEVKGFITRGRGITIHCADCVELEAENPERIIDVEWDQSKNIGSVSARLDVYSIDEPLLLSNVSKVIGTHGVNISEVTSSHIDDHVAVMHFVVLLDAVNQLSAIMKDLEKVKGVTKVQRVRG